MVSWRPRRQGLQAPEGPRKRITLGDHPRCAHEAGCEQFARDVHKLLASGRYDWPASVLPLEDFADWRVQHRTARKRAGHATRLGYTAVRISRADYLDEIYAINTSLPARQGRRMTSVYRKRPKLSRLPDYPCVRHRIDEWGCRRPDGTLVAYLVLYVCGELAMISQILGHGDYLADDVMYLLVADALEHTLADAGALTVFYNRHDSGTDGLRYFKERLGFEATAVEWAL
jgi:hypothetical protein